MKVSTLAAAAALCLLAVGAASAQGGGQDNPMMAKMRTDCGADIMKYCPDKTGPDRRQCVMENHDKFSATCKATLAEMMKAMQAAKPQ
jgi:hypothetical protein